MWLLDANMPLQLVDFLKSLGIETDSAIARGWNRLSNGALVGVAAETGFSALLTRDRLFGESASRALKAHAKFCVILIALPQLRAADFLDAFKAAWDKQPIVPVRGHFLEWPRRPIVRKRPVRRHR